nr:MAG: hypothetical protein EDM05_34370 [Leptolyngbya sp. IPPAS B-1204]
MKYSRIKLLISLFSLAIIIARVALPNLNLDVITLGLLVVAALPWFSDLLQSAELPGGWKVVFKDIAEIKETQEIQGKQIQRLTFLMNNFLTQNQLECLRAMQAGDKFIFNKKSGVVEQAKDDIRRLFSAGLIDRRPGKGFRTLFDQGEDEQNINDHFCITDQGKRFLDLLNPDENAPRSLAA